MIKNYVLMACLGILSLTSCSDSPAEKRAKSCRSWGITNDDDIKKCRESAEFAENIIAQRRNTLVAAEIESARTEYARVVANKTAAVNPDQYEKMSFGELERKLPFIALADDELFRLSLDKKIEVHGVIVIDESGVGYHLWNGEGQGEGIIKIDIEGMNRFERSFIKSRCDIGITKCYADILGRIGNLADQKLPYMEPGLIADQIDIQLKPW